MTGSITEAFRCGACRALIRLTVHADQSRYLHPIEDPRIADRLRLAAARDGWCIDFARRAWCPAHRDHATR